jgi:hypothetical protein
MRITWITVFVVSFPLLAVAEPPADVPADKPDRQESAAADDFSFWMSKKLQYSQDMLQGLATDDLELVATRAKQMRRLAKVEGWVRRGKPGYTAQLQAFSFAGAEIERHARAGNLEAAAMGFQQLTISCVSCHSFLRNPR